MTLHNTYSNLYMCISLYIYVITQYLHSYCVLVIVMMNVCLAWDYSMYTIYLQCIFNDNTENLYYNILKYNILKYNKTICNYNGMHCMYAL